MKKIASILSAVFIMFAVAVSAFALDSSEIIMHEIAHAFGCKDLYNNSNKDSLMYAYGDGGTGINVTSDANKIFNDKYK